MTFAAATFVLPPYSSPSLDHWLGGDALGRPFVSSLLEATGQTLVDVGIASSIALLIAIFLAVLGSVFKGIFGRFVFTLASTFSFTTPLIAVLLLLYSLFGDNPLVFPIGVGCLLWGSAALTLQSAISHEVHATYIKAARSYGISRFRVTVFYMLPNIVTFLRGAWIANWPAMLSASILTAYLGAHGGRPGLGSLLKTGYELFPACWWLWLPPTLIVCMTFVAAFLLADKTAVRRTR